MGKHTLPMNNKWTKEETEYLVKTYPHWGTTKIVKDLSIDLGRAMHKAFKMGLKMLPKSERKCIECNQNPQLDRWFTCRKCFNAQRKIKRRTRELSDTERFTDIVRSCRYRSQKQCGIKCDLTVDFLKKLYEEQNGLCFYSKLPMVFRQYGNGRNAYSISIDKKDGKKGYTKKNVVLCCWAANAGKYNFTIDEYVKFCKSVADNFNNEITRSLSSSLQRRFVQTPV